MGRVSVEEVTPIGRRVICRKYTKPEKVGSIWLNPAWRQDNSRSLWECVKASGHAQEYMKKEFGSPLEPGWILVTPPNRGVHVPQIELPSGMDAFMIRAEVISKVMPWDGETSELHRGLKIAANSNADDGER